MVQQKPCYKNVLFWLIIIGITVFPFFINVAYKIDIGYGTMWNAGDALSYYGSYIGAIGTIILGMVAWQLNKRLLLIEENSFIANNACLGFVNKVIISGVRQKACSFHLHAEQLVKNIRDDSSIHDYSSLNLSMSVQMKENIATLVRVKEVLLILRDSNNIDLLSLYNRDSTYSRVAISPDGIRFEVTLILSAADKEKSIKYLENPDCQLSIDITFTLLTDKYVSTELKCRSELFCNGISEQENIYNNFAINKETPPICFWYGNELVEKNKVKVKNN